MERPTHILMTVRNCSPRRARNRVTRRVLMIPGSVPPAGWIRLPRENTRCRALLGASALYVSEKTQAVYEVRPYGR